MIKRFTRQLVDQVFFIGMKRIRAELFTREAVFDVGGFQIIMKHQIGDHARPAILEFITAFGQPPTQPRLMADEIIKTFADFTAIATADITA